MNWRWSLVLALLASGCGTSSKPKPEPEQAPPEVAEPDVEPGADDDRGGPSWDVYFKQLDGSTASILLDLQYRDPPPPSSADTRYRVRVTMLDPTEHGLGSTPESAALEPIEDAIAERAQALGLVHVAHVKHNGINDIAFYGPTGKLDALRAIAEAAPLGGRRVEVSAEADPGWRYYKDTLVPDPERWQWMGDRRVVDTLREHGDLLVTPRRVDHWAYFSTPMARQRFVDGAVLEGFELDATTDDNDLPRVFGAQVFRTDPVELEAIHAVVMKLVALAERNGGDYDGWETEIVKP